MTTVVLRLALTAPPYYNALLGLAGAVFALGLTLAYNLITAPVGEVRGSGGAPPNRPT